MPTWWCFCTLGCTCTVCIDVHLTISYSGFFLHYFRQTSKDHKLKSLGNTVGSLTPNTLLQTLENHDANDVVSRVPSKPWRWFTLWVELVSEILHCHENLGISMNIHCRTQPVRNILHSQGVGAHVDKLQMIIINAYCRSFGKQTLKWKPLILLTFDFYILWFERVLQLQMHLNLQCHFFVGM